MRTASGHWMTAGVAAGPFFRPVASQPLLLNGGAVDLLAKVAARKAPEAQSLPCPFVFHALALPSTSSRQALA